MFPVGMEEEGRGRRGQQVGGGGEGKGKKVEGGRQDPNLINWNN